MSKAVLRQSASCPTLRSGSRRFTQPTTSPGTKGAEPGSGDPINNAADLTTDPVRPRSACSGPAQFGGIARPLASPQKSLRQADLRGSPLNRARSANSCRRPSPLDTAALDSRSCCSSTLVSGLATPTRQENRKADRIEKQYQRATSAERRPMVQPKERRNSVCSGQGFEPAAAIQDSNFEDDVKHFEGVLAELGKNLQMDHLLEAAEVARRTVQAEQEEESRRPRKLRQPSQESMAALHPRGRIELRLQRAHEAGLAEQVEIINAMGIPVKKHMIHSGHGSEHCELVNVGKLQKRCLGISGDGSSPSNFNFVREIAEIEEKRHLWDNSEHNYVKENMAEESIRSRTMDHLALKLSQQEQRLAEMQRAARKRRKQVAHETYRRKNEAMMGRSHSRFDMETISMVHKERDSKTLRRSGLSSCPPPDAVKEGSRRQSDSALSKTGGQGRARWRTLRAVVSVLWLLQLVRTRCWAGVVLRTFVASLARQVKISKGFHRLSASVRKLQHCLRGFLSRKHTWCDAMSKTWVQHEDKYLQSATKRPANKTGPRIIHLWPDDSLSDLMLPRGWRRSRRSIMECSPDWWHDLRVPAEKRRSTLGRWYVAQVRHWIGTRDRWVSMVRRAMLNHTDVYNYMQLCGISLPAGAKSSENASNWLPGDLPEASLAASLTLGEAETRELIRLAISELEGSAFLDHPMNVAAALDNIGPVSGHLSRILSRRQETQRQERYRRISMPKAELARTGFSSTCLSIEMGDQPDAESW